MKKEEMDSEWPVLQAQSTTILNYKLAAECGFGVKIARRLRTSA